MKKCKDEINIYIDNIFSTKYENWLLIYYNFMSFRNVVLHNIWLVITRLRNFIKNDKNVEILIFSIKTMNCKFNMLIFNKHLYIFRFNLHIKER